MTETALAAEAQPDLKACETCGTELIRRPKEHPSALLRRRYCNRTCAATAMRFTDAEREAAFWRKVDKFGPAPLYAPHLGRCWLWTASLNWQGYGHFRPAAGETGSAHRWAYLRFVGEIPDGLVIDHLCRVPRCVRPSHMEPVTIAENQARGLINQNAPKTHCPEGHPYDKNQGRSTWRKCSICANEYKRRWRAQRRAEGRRAS